MDGVETGIGIEVGGIDCGGAEPEFAPAASSSAGAATPPPQLPTGGVKGSDPIL